MLIERTATTDTTTWTAVIDGTQVAWLSIWTANREISNVETADTHRGRGLARTLFQHANAEDEVFHTIPAHRTPEGDAFAEAVGGDTADEPIVVDCCICDHCDA